MCSGNAAKTAAASRWERGITKISKKEEDK
jgi:hypothetical protein